VQEYSPKVEVDLFSLVGVAVQYSLIASTSEILPKSNRRLTKALNPRCTMTGWFVPPVDLGLASEARKKGSIQNQTRRE
jgi:hypothetical protein